MTRRSGYVRIDVNDVLNEIGDDDLLDELRHRKLTPAGPGETTDLDIVREAHAALARGQITDARIILERILFPKWKSQGACAAQYRSLFGS